MTISDAQRHKLHTRLDQVLGEEDAAVLISHLPPSGWSDVVRTRDLDELERRMDLKFAVIDARLDAVESKFDALRSEFKAELNESLREQTNRFVLANVALLSAFTALQALLS